MKTFAIYILSKTFFLLKTLVFRSDISLYCGGILIPGQEWAIPVTMVDLSSPGDIDWEDTRPDLWLTEAAIEVSLGSASAIPLLNKKVTGYYRVTYDDDLWREMATILNTDHQSIHPYNRAQIICDTAHMSAHGHMDPALAAEVTSWVQHTQEEFVVVRALTECVHNLEKEERRPRRG